MKNNMDMEPEKRLDDSVAEAEAALQSEAEDVTAKEPESDEPEGDTAETEQTSEDDTPEAEQTSEDDIPEEDSQQELGKELEHIRELFQKSLEGEEILIQELEDIPEQTAESAVSAPIMLTCPRCERELEESAFEEDSEYCGECLRKMKRRPVRATGILTLIAVTVSFFACFFFSMTSIIDIHDISDTGYESFFNGYEAYGENRLITACNEYGAYFATADSENYSVVALREYIDALSRCGYYNDAVNVIGNYFTEEQLRLPWNLKYGKIIDKYELYTATYEITAPIISTVFSGQEYSYEETLQELEQLKAETDEQGNRLYSEAFIEFYICEIMLEKGEKLETVLERLKELDKNGKGDEWLYLPSLCLTAAKAGDKQTVEDTYERMLEINAEDTSAYMSYLNYFRFLEQPDTEKMQELCGMAASVSDSGDYSYLHYLAITYLLEGEGASALEAIETYISYSGGYSVTTANLYALAGLYNGDETIYTEIKAMLEYNGYEISELVEGYKNDTITVKEALQDKGGDLG